MEGSDHGTGTIGTDRRARLWRAVVDETKELVDDDLGRIRRQDETQWAEDVAALREMLAELTAKVDGMASSGGGPSPKPTR